jgi:hypothetical protein
MPEREPEWVGAGFNPPLQTRFTPTAHPVLWRIRHINSESHEILYELWDRIVEFLET